MKVIKEVQSYVSMKVEIVQTQPDPKPEYRVTVKLEGIGFSRTIQTFPTMDKEDALKTFKEVSDYYNL